MSNQIVLNALNAQLTQKKNELNEYRDNIYNPALEALRIDILNWLREHVSPKIPNVSACQDRIEIMKTESPTSGWGACTVSLNYDFSSKTYSVKMNWYGSSATVDEENTRLDVEIFGAIASKLHVIEYQFLNVWSPAFMEIDTPLETMQIEIRDIERSIRQAESDIRVKELNNYKQVGFECTLNKRLDCEINWDLEDHSYELKERDHHIQLSFGRSNYDYVLVNSFKVLTINKYKASIEIINNDGPNFGVYEVSAKKFNDFIEKVYNWQNSGSEKYANDSRERFKRYTKVEA